MTKPVASNFTVGFQLVNGWNNVEDNNSGKTMGFTTAWTGKRASWFNTYYVGPEKTSTNKGWRHFYDTVVNLNPNDKTSFYLNFDYGHESRVFDDHSAEWIAFGVAGRYQTTERTAVSLRYERYNDRQGFITGQSQSLNSFTATGEYKWAQGTTVAAGVPPRLVEPAVFRTRISGSREEPGHAHAGIRGVTSDPNSATE